MKTKTKHAESENGKKEKPFINVVLDHTKSTKGTEVFMAPGEDTRDAPLRAQYITKSALPGEVPKKIRIKVYVEEE